MSIDPEGFEKRAYGKGFSFLAGIDEAGRGPLAGPVLAAAVILPERVQLEGLNDSKKLTPKKRNHLFGMIYESAVSVGIGIVDPFEIDRINILQATLVSMAMAVDNLRPHPDYLFIDGTFPIKSILPQELIKQGDSRCSSIAAASIVAKVSRDRIMKIYDIDFPEFGFGKHKGYGTKAHCDAIKNFGCCRIHRKSFRRVKEYV